MTRPSYFSQAIISTVTVAMLMFSTATHAQISDTQDLATQSQAEQDRVKVQEKLEAMGVETLLAKDRVAALSEQEAHALAERIDSLPAGGTLSQMDMVLILLIAILVAIVL